MEHTGDFKMGVEGIRLRFQPKGSMCQRCINMTNDCSNLEFFRMLPILEVIKPEVGMTTMIVKCSEFKGVKHD